MMARALSPASTPRTPRRRRRWRLRLAEIEPRRAGRVDAAWLAERRAELMLEAERAGALGDSDGETLAALVPLARGLGLDDEDVLAAYQRGCGREDHA